MWHKLQTPLQNARHKASSPELQEEVAVSPPSSLPHQFEKYDEAALQDLKERVLRKGVGVSIEAFMRAGFDDELAIILAGFAQFLNSSPSSFNWFLHGDGGGISYDYGPTIEPWEDDCELADGWCEPHFVGLRVVFPDFWARDCPLARKQEFAGGYQEELVWAYLTPENADEVVAWIKYFEFPDVVVEVIRKMTKT